MRTLGKWAIALLVMAIGFYYYRKLIPIYRAEVSSQLIMLGDLDEDHQWGPGDSNRLEVFLGDPFAFSDAFARRIDLNQNGFIDAEDLAILKVLVSHPDPYSAERETKAKGLAFPHPREFYRYEPVGTHGSRPLWALPPPNPVPALRWTQALKASSDRGSYSAALNAEIYNEAIRLQEAYRKREPGLTPLESEHAKRKLTRCEDLLRQGDSFELLLELMALVEDAETLSATPTHETSIRLLRFRDHLRALLASPLFERFRRQEASWQSVQEAMELDLKSDLGLDYRLATLPPPRNLTHLQNYLQRAEWQYYKTSATSEDFRQLLDYAQHDARYLRAVSRTSQKHQDPGVENHNLPMVLLFREAIRIKGGNKKRAVGLLDEAIRIPFAWIKSIPTERLPHSLALDNFLLPGNKEDGSDKSRHWNVFGGICLYKSPEEALDLALKREIKDLKESGYSVDGMTEFIRDMIANLNGMYHVLAMDPPPLPDVSSRYMNH